MTQKLFAIRDAKGEIYGPPMVNLTNGEAERHFVMMINDEKSMLSKYPEDFDLYFLGSYDTGTGKLEPLDSPLHICKAIDRKGVVQ